LAYPPIQTLKAADFSISGFLTPIPYLNLLNLPQESNSRKKAAELLDPSTPL
jgi:hypothetical protein